MARSGASVSLAPAAVRRMSRSRRIVDAIVRRNEVAYGITTGFGEFANVRIAPRQARELQRNLLMSHAAGVGDPFPTEIVRAAMLVRANALAIGFSGSRPQIVRALILMLNRGVHPVVPSQGSLGASGDLAPLAHLALPLIGLGWAEYRGKVLAGADAMRKARIRTMDLASKEGLALVNGTAFMAGIGALAVHDSLGVLEDAQIAGAMSLEALLGTDHAFVPVVGRLRPHPGQVKVAQTLRRLTRGSEIIRSHRRSTHRVQDAYSIRCMPQVLGASLDAVRYAERVVATELNSVTDNPLILPGEGSVSAGNFHGQPLALALDFLAIALAEVADIGERRVDRLVNPHFSELPAFLTTKGGLHSGLMVAQYTAASLVSENKVLAHPASVDSIPTSGNQEDHVSMGLTAAWKARRVLANVQRVAAIEYLCAAQALDFRRPFRPGRGCAAAYDLIRSRVRTLQVDRVLSQDIEALAEMVRSGTIRERVAAKG